MVGWFISKINHLVSLQFQKITPQFQKHPPPPAPVGFSSGLFLHGPRFERTIFSTKLIERSWSSIIKAPVCRHCLEGFPSYTMGKLTAGTQKKKEVWKMISLFNCQVLPSDLFGRFKWPFQGLSDLHLGYQKVTWKKLVGVFLGSMLIFQGAHILKLTANSLWK